MYPMYPFFLRGVLIFRSAGTDYRRIARLVKPCKCLTSTAISTRYSQLRHKNKRGGIAALARGRLLSSFPFNQKLSTRN